MTKINYFREDLAKLLSKYDAELSIDDKGNIIQVYFWEEKKTYSVCKNVPDLKEESINYKDVRLSIEVDSKDYIMTPKEKAQDLVNQFRIVLMDEDTDCGNELLCTSIAIKNALILVENVKGFANPCCISDSLKYWREVKQELEKL